MLMVAFASTPARAQASEPLKPYVVLILDTSGSMDVATGSGPTSCGTSDIRFNHATCAINKIVNSYGDMVFALGRFRETTSGTFSTSCDANGDLDGNVGQDFPVPSGGDQCSTQGAYCGNCDEAVGTPTTGFGACTTADREFEVLTPLVDGNNDDAALYTDGVCSTCTTALGGQPELWGVSPYTFTPLAAVMNGAKTYWRGSELASDGTTVIWPSTSAGFAPIANDPTNTAFLPQGCDSSPGCTVNCCASQCRPYITILLTDGAETCTTFSNTTAAAASLLTTDIGGRRYRIETKPIGFGIAPGDAQIEGIAQAGGEPNLTGNEGFYASDEASLQLAISSILDDAIRTEVCNNVDDDCDNVSDEGFTKGTNCNNNGLGRCLVSGATECRADGAGTQCSAGRIAACASAADGTACTVTNVANMMVTGTCQASVCQPTADADEVISGNGCNSIDDDCDGRIDEGLTCTCVPVGETCNNMDDDCDNLVDENLSIPCGTGVCQGVIACDSATMTYPAASCTAPTAGTEVCNGVDDDCDGNADGFTEACSNLSNGYPALDSRNNPGDPNHTTVTPSCETLGALCICNPGSRTCPLNGSGAFTACTGEVTPQLEICNGLDDDCDGRVDETPVISCTDDTGCANSPLTPTCNNPGGTANGGTCEPADCSSNCGVGQLVCVNGMQQCDSVPASSDDTCNGVDDDCDNMIDEDWLCTDPDGPDNIPGNVDDCPCTASAQCNARESCQNGGVVCMGDPVGQESCNCSDDDCDSLVDEGSLCGAGATCTSCQCAFQCIPGEFACPMGKACIGGFCLADPCFNFTCPVVAGDKQICRPLATNPSDKECVSACAPGVHNCNAPNICFLPTGECKPDDCSTFPDRCAANQNCINGTCVTNPCQGVTCAAGQTCVSGQCFGSCAGVTCPDGERCRLGVCETNPCNPPCPAGQVCQDEDGSCIANPCGFVVCPQGQYCNANNGGMCEDDPCEIFDIQCATGEVCVGGTCFDEDDFKPDAGTEVLVTTGGGGGCSTTGSQTPASGSLLLGLGIVMWLRRRRVGGAS